MISVSQNFRKIISIRRPMPHTHTQTINSPQQGGRSPFDEK